MTGSPFVLGALDPDAPLPFPHRSLVRAAVAEPVTALLVQRALVMDVAHPKVAAAVADHSRFQRRPLSRAWVTADTALRLVFGNEQVARGAVRQIYGVDDHIHGELGRRVDRGPVGPEVGVHEQYTAHDASLLAWVWATLVDTAETAYTRWVRPFDAAEAESFYGEMRLLARFLGIPDDLLPPDRHAFSRYLDAALDDQGVGSSQESRSVARQVLWFAHRSVPSPIVRVERVLALRTLDPRLVDRLDIRPGTADLDLGRKLDNWLGSYYRRLPRLPGILPALYVLMRGPTINLAGRVRAAQSYRSPFSAP